jgi:hypothetical protein
MLLPLTCDHVNGRCFPLDLVILITSNLPGWNSDPDSPVSILPNDLGLTAEVLRPVVHVMIQYSIVGVRSRVDRLWARRLCRSGTGLAPGLTPAGLLI